MCATMQRSLAAGGCTSLLGVSIASMPCFPQMAKMAATAGRPLEEVLRWSHNAGSYSVTAHRGRGGGLTSTAEQVWLVSDATHRLLFDVITRACSKRK